MAMIFDGVGDAVDLAAGTPLPLINGKAAVTLMAWFWPDTAVDPNPEGPNFSNHNGGTPTNASRAALDRDGGGQLEAVIKVPDSTGKNLIDNAGAIPAGQWTHIAAVIDVGNNIVRIYRNGALTREANPHTFTQGTFQAGDSPSGSLMAEDQANALFVAGRMRDARAYDRALKAQEIATIARLRGADNIRFQMVHRWKLNELAPGQTPAGAGSIRDYGSARRNANPVGTPDYISSPHRGRRRRASA